MRRALLTAALLLGACDDTPPEPCPRRYVVDVFFMGPPEAMAHADEYIAEAQLILGMVIEQADVIRPGVVAITLTEGGRPNGAQHSAVVEKDPFAACFRVGWANSGHSLAHELGHALGLRHLGSIEEPDLSGNLMSQPEPGFDVTDEQLDRMTEVAGVLSDWCR